MAATTATKPNKATAKKTKRPTAVTNPAKSRRQQKPAIAAEPTSHVRPSKQHLCLELLKRSGGTTLDDLIAATGWQAHSVRGFLSGTVRRKLGLEMRSEKQDGEARRYHVEG